MSGKFGNLPGPDPGRPKGGKNKITRLLKEAILEAAENAGGKAGIIGYLTEQAEKSPGPFMALLGKVLPLQVANAEGESLSYTVITGVPRSV